MSEVGSEFQIQRENVEEFSVGKMLRNELQIH